MKFTRLGGKVLHDYFKPIQFLLMERNNLLKTGRTTLMDNHIKLNKFSPANCYNNYIQEKIGTDLIIILILENCFLNFKINKEGLKG